MARSVRMQILTTIFSRPTSRITSALVASTLLGSLWGLVGFMSLFPTMAQADFFIHRWRDMYCEPLETHIKFGSDYYFTNSNFLVSGQNLTPSGFHSLQRFQEDLTLRHGLTDSLSLFGRLAWAHISVDSMVNNGTNFGLTDQTVGASYRLFNRALPNNPRSFLRSLDLQIQIDFPGYSNSVAEAAQRPLLGDGTVDLTTGLFSSFRLYSGQTHEWHTLIGGGLTYRNQGYSAAIPWVALIQYAPFDHGFFFNIGGGGFTSLRTDNTHPSTLLSNFSSGGSFFTGEINASLYQGMTKVGYLWGGGTELSFSGVHALAGDAAPKGTFVVLEFEVKLGRVDRRYVYQEADQRFYPDEHPHVNRGFLNYSLTAKVTQTNDRMNLIKIDKGSQDGIKKGQTFDIFELKKDEAVGHAIARGVVSAVKIDETAITITDYFKEVSIDTGFLAKRLIQ